MRWVLGFVAMAMGGIALILFVLWAMNGFHGLGLDTVGTLAIIGGMIATSGLGVGLMALVFYSDRSNKDEEVYRTGRADGENGAGPPRRP